MQPVTTAHVLRRPTPPAASSGTPPPSPFPSPSNRTPLLRPPELPLPSALVPPKKRRVMRTPPKATTPLPPPPPPPVPAVAVPSPTPPPPQADHAESPLFSAQKPPPPPPAENPASPPPPPPPAGKPPSPPPPPPPEENPFSPPQPPPPAEKPPSPPPPPPAEKPSSPPPPPPVAENPSSLLPPPPPSVADEKPSVPSPADADAEPSPATKPRKITRKVRTVIRRVPKGTIAARKAAAEAYSADAAGALQPGKGHAPDKSSPNAAAVDEGGVQKEQSFGGNTIEKPGTTCNPTAVCETLLGKGTAVCETLLGKGTAGGGTLGSVPAKGIDAEHEEKKLGSRGEDKAEVVMSERQRRRMTEVFVGGLDRDAKEEDVRAALSVAGEITEVRMTMDATAKKNKGYCFVRYRESAQARKAIAKFSNVKICGKKCRVAALDGNDKIFLGNIDKKWKKEDIVKLLQKIGVENIDVVTLLADSNNPGYNRGFAFLELETYSDAQIAYRKLSRKDVFGKGLNIRVAWTEPLSGPDENQMHKVKAVFVEGVPNSWDQAKLTEIFKEYGRVELVVLSRDMHRAKRNDFAWVHYTTHEAAILCLESFDGVQLTENGLKVDIRVSLAKSVQKGKNNMEDHKFCINQKVETKTAKSERKLGPSSQHIFPSSSSVIPISGYKKSSTTHGFLQVLRELAPWRHGHTGSGSLTKNYPRILPGEKRPFSALGIDSYSTSHIPHAGHERNTYATPASSCSASPPAITQYSPYHHESRRCLLDSDSVLSEPWGGIQIRQACSRKSGMSHDS